MKKGFYKVTIRSLRTGLEFWTVVEAQGDGEAEMKGYQIVKNKKGGWWPQSGQCKMTARYLGKTRPEMTDTGELVETPAPEG